jgi:hypothetical protein
MEWGRIAAYLLAALKWLQPYVEKALLLYAGKKWQQADTANQALKDVRAANEAVAAHAADTPAERLRRMDKAKRVRD